MLKRDTTSPAVPAVILCAQVAALALTRRLGRAGVRVGLVDAAPQPVAAHSRYARHWERPASELRTAASPSDELWLAAVMRARAAVVRGCEERPALIATSDETVFFVARHQVWLKAHFRLLLPPAALIERLLDKRQLHQLAAAHGVAVPRSLALDSAADLGPAARELGFPCLLKSAHGKLAGGSEVAGKRRVATPAELEAAYTAMARYDGQLLLQEYLAGGARLVALYNAYFNAASRPVAVFTGRKLRQYPLEFGTASHSCACAMPGLAAPLTAMLEALQYVGPVDIGLKWDARARVYKLLDLNPRLGQNYRTFVARGRDRADLGWLAYRELAEGALAAPPVAMAARRRQWKMEDHDLSACRELRRCHERRAWSAAAEWARLLLGPHEFAYWSWRDRAPAVRRWRMLAERRQLALRPALPAHDVEPAAEPERAAVKSA